ncbi:OadG family protein [Halomarina pelagica]|uniref:OadG family protein n=1 Tax=Halomarina pelagica TaxID=2961599 RepID=UPI0020C1C998|nr:OadG family protein [Halomarina sp. BND7]
MSDSPSDAGDVGVDTEHEHHESDTPEPRPDERQTAPQGPYTTGQVTTGFVVALVGMAVVFGVPILLTLS